MNRTLNKLRQEGLLDEETIARLEDAERNHLFSVFWHIKALLYLGVSMLAGGLGILIYKNIDTIGHLTIVIFIGIGTAGCFIFSFIKSPPFSIKKMETPGILFDYILLLGCLLLLTFLAYLQWQYTVFGARFGLATAIPALILLAAAYRFDHLGVLTMGLTLFASWIGISITPLELLTANDFNSVRIVYTGLALAAIFALSAFLHHSKNIKRHFTFTFMNFAAHLAGIFCLAGLFTQPYWIVWILLLALAVGGMYYYARVAASFYFTLITIAYGYIGVAYVFTTQVVKWMPNVLSFYIIFIFYIMTCYILVRFIKQIRKKMKQDDVV